MTIPLTARVSSFIHDKVSLKLLIDGASACMFYVSIKVSGGLVYQVYHTFLFEGVHAAMII